MTLNILSTLMLIFFVKRELNVPADNHLFLQGFLSAQLSVLHQYRLLHPAV